ncbi:hypothetical protein K8R61_02030 [bacterium]|nr:hypothetical protein [bacterium]
MILNLKKWTFNVRRQSSVFSASIMTEAFANSKLVKTPFFHKNIMYINNEWWFLTSEHKNMQESLKAFYKKDLSYFSNIIKEQIEYGNELKFFIRSLCKKYENDMTVFSQKDFLEYYKKNLEFYSFYLFITSGAGEIFEKELKHIFSKRNININFNDTVYPSRELELSKARKELLKIGLNIKIDSVANFKFLNDTQRKALDKHAQKYGWESYSFHIGKILKSEDYFKKLKKIDIKKEFQEIEKSKVKQKEILIKAKKVLSSEEFKILQILQDIIYFRNFQKETMNECQFLSLNYLSGLARFLNINIDDLLLLVPREIIDALEGKNKINLKKVRQRKVNFRIMLKNKKCSVYSGKIKVEKSQKSLGNFKKIRGQSAYKGKSEGLVRIIVKKDDFINFKKDEILVTSMTSVDFIDVIKKSKAIITDEGGVTCHAAILSREMKKPCIIGTKVATQILKDGDLVEVDANKGIVNIIK